MFQVRSPQTVGDRMTVAQLILALGAYHMDTPVLLHDSATDTATPDITVQFYSVVQRPQSRQYELFNAINDRESESVATTILARQYSKQALDDCLLAVVLSVTAPNPA